MRGAAGRGRTDTVSLPRDFEFVGVLFNVHFSASYDFIINCLNRTAKPFFNILRKHVVYMRVSFKKRLVLDLVVNLVVKSIYPLPEYAPDKIISNGQFQRLCVFIYLQIDKNWQIG